MQMMFRVCINNTDYIISIHKSGNSGIYPNTFISMFLLDRLEEYSIDKYKDPRLQLLSSVELRDEVPLDIIPISLHHVLYILDHSTYRLMVVNGKDSFEIKRGIKITRGRDREEIDRTRVLVSNDNGLLFTIHKNRSVEVRQFIYKYEEYLDYDIERKFEDVFNYLQTIDINPLMGEMCQDNRNRDRCRIYGAKGQKVPGDFTFLMVWSKTKAWVFVNHHGFNNINGNWITKFTLFDHFELEKMEPGESISEVYVENTYMNYLRQSSKIVLVSYIKKQIKVRKVAFCMPSEIQADSFQDCVQTEKGKIRFDWGTETQPGLCGNSIGETLSKPSFEELEEVSWLGYCANSYSSQISKNKAEILKPDFKGISILLDSAPIHRHLTNCSLYKSKEICNYDRYCIFQESLRECISFNFASVNGLIAQSDKWIYYETGRMAWELAHAKHIGLTHSDREAKLQLQPNSTEFYINFTSVGSFVGK